MPAWIAGIQIRKDASGNIHVNLDSSTSCWNDTIGGFCLNGPRPLRPVFSKEHTKSAKEGKHFFQIRSPFSYPIFVSFATFVVSECFDG